MNSQALSDLVRRWQTGWCLCRGLRRATLDRGGWHVKLGLPGRYHEIVTADADGNPGSVAALADEVNRAAQPTWLTVITGDPQQMRAKLEQAGLELVVEPQTLMTTDIRKQPVHLPPEGYQAGTNDQGTPIEALVTLDTGEVVASGIMAVTGTDAVAHHIRTDPAHRRRGLAEVVMTALCQRAVDDGARTGLAVVGPDGTDLFTKLGWRSKATVLSARVPVGE